MIVTPNPSFKTFSGNLDRIIFYTCYGQVRARSYAVPRDPKTKKQRAQRSSFALAVQAWKALSADRKDNWNAVGKEENRSGYNAFLSARLRGREEHTAAEQTGVHEACIPAADNSSHAPLPLQCNYSHREYQDSNNVVSTSFILGYALGVSPYFMR